MRSFRATLARIPAAVVVALGLLSCATNPVTGKSELAFVSESQEIAMGRDYAVQVKQETGVYPDSAVQAYVSRIGLAIARTTERPSLPWAFTVMDDPQVNAFALPGGPIFVTRGILTHMNSEAELAAVIGHEIGHVTARHSVQQMTRQQLTQLGMVAGAIASSRIADNLGLISQVFGVLSLKYSRDDETQADGLGFRYALDNGYDVRKMVDMFTVLQRVSAKAGQRIPEWQSTHPDPGNRIATTQRRIAKVTVPLDDKIVNRDGFLRTIDGMVYGDNPRNGFFKDSRFYQPDLAFSLDFPAGWRTLNQAQSVIGGSPKQDAQVQLSFAGQEAPGELLKKFMAQQGLRPGQSGSTTINGIPAAVGAFTAQQEDGSELAGRVAYLSYGGITYQLMGVGTAAGWPANDRLVQQFIGSFRRVTDPAVLNVRPNRLSITRVGKAMTLTEFNRQYPSVISIEELALINGLADGNAALAAGTSMKRVVGM